MEQAIVAPQRDTNSLGITNFSVLMQIRATVLNDLTARISADYYSSRAIGSKLVIYESENLDRIRHLAGVDFNLAKELVEENDRKYEFTPREVSATEVLGAVGYCLMFLALDESQRTPHRLDRMHEAESKLKEALTVYVMYLDDAEARLITAALAVGNSLSMITTGLQSAANGTAVVWTPERKLEAQQMLASEKAGGVKAYAANTAVAFGVTTTRLRQVLSDKPKKALAKKTASPWGV